MNKGLSEEQREILKRNKEVYDQWSKYQNGTDKLYKYQKIINKIKWLRDGESREVLKPLAYNQGFYKFIKGSIRFLGKALLNQIFTLFNPNVILKKPIFVIGMPHSGTTISMTLLSQHSDISNSSEMNTFFYPKGDYTLPEREHFKDKSMASESEVKRLNSRFNFYRYIHGNKKRFLNKNPMNMVTVDFLKSCFPDAYFIHVVRDPRAYINSSIYSLPNDIESFDRFQSPEKRVNIFAGPRVTGWRELIRKDPVEQHALQWKACIELVRKQSLDIENFLEIRYEDLCLDTKATIKKVWDFVKLEDNGSIEKVPQKLESKNYKYSKRFSKEKIQLVEKITEDIMKEYNYKFIE